VKLTKNIAASLFFGLFLLTISQCVQPPNYPNEPVITFKSLSRTTLRQGTGTFDTTFATISFTDGDGDLGDSDSLNVFLIDKRDNFLKSKYRLPFIPEEGVGNGISGDITLRVNTSCCIFPNNVLPPCSPSTQFPTDTLRYIIFIKDRAGHESNHVETSDIILLCQ
jgi:hypothetical protein